MVRTVDVLPAPSHPDYGCISNVEDRIAESLATIPFLWNFLGVGGYDGAKQRIYFYGAPEPVAIDGDVYSEAAWKKIVPCVTIFTGRFGLIRTAGGTYGEFTAGGNVNIQFDWFADKEYAGDIPKAKRKFMNHIGLIMGAMTDTLPAAGVDALGITLVEQWAQGREETHDLADTQDLPYYRVGDLYGAMLEMEWGSR